MSSLTKKDLSRFKFEETFFPRAIALNYESMHSAGFSYGMSHALRKIYDDEDPQVVAEKLDKYLAYYNTNPLLSPFIAGTCLAIEETKEPGCTDAAVALRSGLMGPFAGMGDSLFFMNGKVILSSLAGYMALNGSPVGFIICLIVGIALYIARYKLVDLGHSQGVNFITSHAERLNMITGAFVVLGMVVIGAMIPSTVKFTLIPVFEYGDAVVSISEFVDSIVPYLLPTLATVAVYFGLNIKGMSTVRMVWAVIAVAVVLTLIGVI